MKILQTQEKSKHTRSRRPINFNKKVLSILHYELSGWTRQAIADRVNLTLNAVNVICTNDNYKARFNSAMSKVEDAIIAQRAKEAIEDVVVKTFREAAPAAALKKVDLMNNASSEFVQSSNASEILDRAGYKVEQKKFTSTTEVSEEIATRWEKLLVNPEVTVTKKITRKVSE